MRQNYTCIGACFDMEGIALIRFDLVETQFKIYQCRTFLRKETNYDSALAGIVELAAIETDQPVQSIEVLSNFTSSLKNYIINKHTSDHTIRVRTTPVSDDKQNMILNLINIMNQNRIAVKQPDQAVDSAIEEMMKTNKKKLRDIYEGNVTLSHVSEAILHSISWLEGQLIKHKMI